jgi:hypothetical protein
LHSIDRTGDKHGPWVDYFSDQKASEESSLPAMLKDREMMIVENYVAPSEIHGVGLFEGEDIEKDQIIYILDRKRRCTYESRAN